MSKDPQQVLKIKNFSAKTLDLMSLKMSKVVIIEPKSQLFATRTTRQT